MIFLNEIKNDYCFSISGFNTVRSHCLEGEENRGGVAILIKHALWTDITDLDIGKDQIWFSLQIIPGIVFGAVYMSPADSLYYSTEPFEKLLEKWSEGQEILLIGDLNARLGDLNVFEDKNIELKYTDNVDPVINENGHKLRNMSSEMELIPVNHAITSVLQHEGNFTFKKKDRWISQLDWCFVSKNILKDVTCFKILQNCPLVSDHAALDISVYRICSSLENIKESALLLDCYKDKEGSRRRATIKYSDMDMVAFKSNLCNADDLWDHENIITEVSNYLYEACVTATCRTNSCSRKVALNTRGHDRWRVMLENKDEKRLWQAIDWKGRISTPPCANIRPSDEEFAQHFRSLLNPEGYTEELSIPTSRVYIPILDDDITPGEVVHQIGKLKPGKAAGPDSIPPGSLKLIPDEWILLITFILNSVFSGSYPESWSTARLFVIFKKGLVADTNNYRGISVGDALPKLYDAILNSRMVAWSKPYPEQAGAQAGRGCEEQILALRLFIDIAKKKKITLYLLFVDYVKAYDRVNRNKLLKMLCEKGCGNRFLSAIGNSLKNTYGMIGNRKFGYTRGVKQGSSTSCTLFTLYLDCTIQAVRTYGDDGFLGDCHIMLLMDDTVLLATSRIAMQRKLELLYNCATDIDMKMHPEKSKFIVINAKDTVPFQVGDIEVMHTDSYTYLGSPISADSISKQVENQLKTKQNQIIKYNSFVKKNYNAPYQVKLKVLQAAVSSSLLYSCETWLSTNLKRADTVVASCLKTLLDVRVQTNNDIIYIETDTPPTSTVIRKRQIKFFRKLDSRIDLELYPVGKAVNLARNVKSPMGRFINSINTAQDPQQILEESIECVRNKTRQSTSTRLITYRSINPSLSKHPVYTYLGIPEADRIAFTRLRLSSHYLRIETGRWSRLERNSRKCICGAVQTEEHVVISCPETESLRQEYSMLTFTDISSLMDSTDLYSLAQFCRKVLMKMNKNY